MRRLKLVGAAILAIVAISAIASAAASAAPEFLPGAVGETFFGTSKSGTLFTSSKGNIECAADTNKGEIIQNITRSVGDDRLHRM